MLHIFGSEDSGSEVQKPGKNILPLSLCLSVCVPVSISLSVCLSLQTSSRKNGRVITSTVETVWEMICSDAPATQTVVRAHKMRNMILLQAPGHTPLLKKRSTAYWCCGMRRFRRGNSRLGEKNETKHRRIFPLWALQELEHFFKRWASPTTITWSSSIDGWVTMQPFGVKTTFTSFPKFPVLKVIQRKTLHE